jgi:hypothetical protein
MPHRRGLAQLRLRCDLKIDTERVQRLAHRVDHQLVLMPVLGRRGKGGATGLVGVVVLQPRRRPGERAACDIFAAPRHQQFGARTDQRDP